MADRAANNNERTDGAAPTRRSGRRPANMGEPEFDAAADPAEDGAATSPAEDGQRLTRWDLRRLRTRKLILHAGRDVFADRAYVTPRVEDVARAAGVSRAAFYLHFKSLDELVIAVFEREIRWQLRRYRGLTSDVLTSERRARGWLERFFASFRSERQYMLIVYRALTADPGNMSMIFEGHRRVIRHLARRVPELALNRPDGTLDIARAMEFNFLLRRIEEMSLFSAYNAWTEGFEQALDQTAQDLVRFGRAPRTSEGESSPAINT